MKKEIVTDRPPAASPRRLFALGLRRLSGVMSVAAPAVLLCLTLLALATVQTQAQSFTGSLPVVGALTPAPGVGGTFNYLDLSAFTSTPSVNGPFVGTIGRNTFRAPGLQTWNLSFLRNINLTESKKLQFRAEMFNPFNHPNLFVAGGTNNIANNPTNTVEATRGGLFDNINNVEQHRNVQLALKFIF